MKWSKTFRNNFRYKTLKQFHFEKNYPKLLKKKGERLMKKSKNHTEKTAIIMSSLYLLRITTIRKCNLLLKIFLCVCVYTQGQQHLFWNNLFEIYEHNCTAERALVGMGETRRVLEPMYFLKFMSIHSMFIFKIRVHASGSQNTIVFNVLTRSLA